jgi:hypothetical protein
VKKSKKNDLFDLKLIDQEIAEIDAKIKEFQILVQRRNDLTVFKQLAQRLFLHTDDNGASAEPQHKKRGTTGAMAFEVLAAKGDLDLDGILLEMRQNGWTGSGDDAKDKKRIYAAIYKDPNFERNGEKWGTRM